MITDYEGENPATLQELLTRTEQGRAILAKLQGAEENYPELLGAFLPGLTKIIKKIGKFTSPITTKIGKLAAGLVGIPASAIDSLAKADPTAHAALIQQLAAKIPAGQTAAAVTTPGGKKTGGISPLYIGLAAGGAAIIILTIILTKKKRR